MGRRKYVGRLGRTEANEAPPIRKVRDAGTPDPALRMIPWRMVLVRPRDDVGVGVRTEDIEEAAWHVRRGLLIEAAVYWALFSGSLLLATRLSGRVDSLFEIFETVFALGVGAFIGLNDWRMYRPQVSWVADLLPRLLPRIAQIADSRGIARVVFDNGMVLRVGGNRNLGHRWSSYSFWIFLSASGAIVHPDAEAAVLWTTDAQRRGYLFTSEAYGPNVRFERVASGPSERTLLGSQELLRLRLAYQATTAEVSLRPRKPTGRAPDAPPRDAVLTFETERRFPSPAEVLSNLDSQKELLEGLAADAMIADTRGTAVS